MRMPLICILNLVLLREFEKGQIRIVSYAKQLLQNKYTKMAFIGIVQNSGICIGPVLIFPSVIRYLIWTYVCAICILHYVRLYFVQIASTYF